LVTTWPLLIPTKSPDFGCVGAMRRNPFLHRSKGREIKCLGRRRARVSDRLLRRRLGEDAPYLEK
jgi:hypothetical protein